MSRKNKKKNKRKKKGRAPLNTSRRLQNRNRMGKLRMQHKEFLCDVFGDAEYHQGINPGLSVCFPWLSTIAAGFEMYNWHHLTFEFVPSVSATKPGLIALCPDFDPDDEDDPMVRRDFYQFEKTVRDSVWKGVTLRLTQKDLQKRKNLFVRMGSEQELRLSDALQLFVITSGVGDQTALGELWVSYDITLEVPQIASDISMPQQTLYKTSDYAPGFATTYPWLVDNGTDAHKVTYQGSRAATVYPDTANGTKYYFPEPGYYTLDVSVLADQLSAVPWDAMTLTGGELLQAEGQQGSGFFEQVLGFLVDKTASETNPAFIEWAGPTAEALIDIGVWVADTALPVLTNFFGHFFEAGIPFIMEDGKMKLIEKEEEEEGEVSKTVRKRLRNRKKKNRRFGTSKDGVTFFCAYNSKFAKSWQKRNCKAQLKRNHGRGHRLR